MQNTGYPLGTTMLGAGYARQTTSETSLIVHGIEMLLNQHEMPYEL